MFKPVYWLQPLKDARWSGFLQRHAHSSVFHTAAWLEALVQTYGYEATAVTTCPPDGDLQNAAVFCRVHSWLTGRRLVSLPFSDHCAPLLDCDSDWDGIVSALGVEMREQRLRYIEMRPPHEIDAAIGPGYHSTYTYCLHQIDLKPNLDALFGNCHLASTQRKIRRAKREGLTYQEGRSDTLLKIFYRLLILTRRRHMSIPQPKRWFRNLIDCFGEALKIRVAFKNRTPIAAILTLRYKDTLVYKYGCSDAQFHQLGAMHLLLWRSIVDAKREGLRVFDLGRSDCENSGLIAFKDRWGTTRSMLTYFRLSGSVQLQGDFVPSGAQWQRQVAKWLVPHCSDRILGSIGNLVYRHMG